MKTALLFAAVLAASPALAARAKPKARRAESSKKKPAAAEVPTSSAPQVAAAPPPRDEACLAAFGASLIEDADGLLAVGAWPGSPASQTGLRGDDRLLFTERAPARTRAGAAASLRAAVPEERESLVVRRGLAPFALVGPQTPAPTDAARGPHDLSPREWALARARAEKSSATARDAVTATPPLDWSLRADQAVWVRFPDGLPAGLKKGAVVQAETAAALTTDSSLDFLSVPSKSRVWARVGAAGDDGAVRTLRLVFYKIQPAGGGVYPMLGAATALAGVAAADLARVSPGGTLIVAAPLPEAAQKRKGSDLLLDEDARLRVRLLEPVTLIEPPSWWRAGPGLWIKTAADDGRRRFEVTHAVAGRSASASGLKPGDLLDAVAGRSAEKLDFTDALDALYGAPGSTVKVSVLRDGKPVELTLARGVKLEKGASAPLPLPFETR